MCGQQGAWGLAKLVPGACISRSFHLALSTWYGRDKRHSAWLVCNTQVVQYSPGTAPQCAKYMKFPRGRNSLSPAILLSPLSRCFTYLVQRICALGGD